jgi:hypothetical protein
VKIVTIAFASAIALSTVVPAFAYENDLETVTSASSMQPKVHRRAGMHANAHRAIGTRAYAPAPAPADAPVVAPYDFGIGNQGT